jgi:hypothetical protein
MFSIEDLNKRKKCNIKTIGNSSMLELFYIQLFKHIAFDKDMRQGQLERGTLLKIIT